MMHALRPISLLFGLSLLMPLLRGQAADSASPLSVAQSHLTVAERRGNANIYKVHFTSGRGIWPSSVDTVSYPSSLDMGWRKGPVRFAWAKSKADSVYEIFVYDQQAHRVGFQSDAGDTLSVFLLRGAFEMQAYIEKGYLHLTLINGSVPYFLALSQPGQRRFFRLDKHEPRLRLDILGAQPGPCILSAIDRFGHPCLGPEVQLPASFRIQRWYYLLPLLILLGLFFTFRNLPKPFSR